MADRILVVAAHPDDEILGCGGTIAKHVKEGREVRVCLMAEGLTSRQTARHRVDVQQEISDLAGSALRANGILGVADVQFLDFPDNRMDSVDLLDVVKAVESLISSYQPQIIYTHHVGDLNIDHGIVHRAVVTACRPIPGQHKVDQLLFFEVASSTEWQVAGAAPTFQPNIFCDISDQLQRKLRALQEYASEMREWPHPRSERAVEHLAHWRGASVGVEAAESFMLGRWIC